MVLAMKANGEHVDATALGGGAMSPKQFRQWRKSLGLKQREAAELLGLKKRMIQYYERGERDGKPITIPKYVRLACYAVSKGINDYDGQEAVRAKSD